MLIFLFLTTVNLFCFELFLPVIWTLDLTTSLKMGKGVWPGRPRRPVGTWGQHAGLVTQD